MIHKRTKQFPVLVTLFCVGLVACGDGGSNLDQQAPASNNALSEADTAQRILNGEPTQAPQVVGVTFSHINGDQSSCTAIVVGARAAITAGHCIGSGLIAARLHTSLGERQVDAVHIHPSYREDQKLGVIFNDLAVLVVDQDLGLPSFPLSLSAEVSAGELLQVLGLGVDGEGNAGMLRKGVVTVESVTQNHLVSRPFEGDGSNPCAGDSGGPLLHVQNETGAVTVLGLVSTGTDPDCGKGDVTFYFLLRAPGAVEFVAQYVQDLSLK